jgi:hypothetical protein
MRVNGFISILLYVASLSFPPPIRPNGTAHALLDRTPLGDMAENHE